MKIFLLLLLIGAILSGAVIAKQSSATLNWASKRYVDSNFCQSNGEGCAFDWLSLPTVPFYINVESCMRTLCTINVSTAPENYSMVARPGRIFLLVTEPNE